MGQRSYSCVVHSLEGRRGNYPVSGEDGKEISISLGERVILPECSIDILRNARYRDYAPKLDPLSGQMRSIPIMVSRFSVELHEEMERTLPEMPMAERLEVKKAGRPRNIE